MATMVTERVEAAARGIEASTDGFERFGSSARLVMSSPATITVTTLFITQWTTAFAGGSDRTAIGKSLGENETTPSLEDLIRLHE